MIHKMFLQQCPLLEHVIGLAVKNVLLVTCKQRLLTSAKIAEMPSAQLRTGDD